MNIQVPWIYIIRNTDLLSRDNQYQNPNFDEELERRYKEQREADRLAEIERRQKERQSRR